jgi:hypothetical protein
MRQRSANLPAQPPLAGQPAKASNCFLPSTKIKTPKGDVCIEELRIGDRVLTVTGEAKQIRFIGVEI